MFGFSSGTQIIGFDDDWNTPSVSGSSMNVYVSPLSNSDIVFDPSSMYGSSMLAKSLFMSAKSLFPFRSTSGMSFTSILIICQSVSPWLSFTDTFTSWYPKSFTPVSIIASLCVVMNLLLVSHLFSAIDSFIMSSAFGPMNSSS